MKRVLAITLFLVSITAVLYADDPNTPYHPQVSIMTSKGEIVVELRPEKAPKTVENFLEYVNSGFYENTIFHRVIKGFMIQGGGLTADLNKKKTRDPIRNEADNRLSNRKYTIAMARTNDPHSATSQFFINTASNAPLDFKNQSQAGWGYCVFGRVIKGMEVVDAIENVKTSSNGMMNDVPVETIVITGAKVLNPPAEKESNQ
ncbi:MAG: peptidyl-prolyl cis-trans isomerase [Fibrobacter sp.]|jgi:peptidyl-prolyl cis-trans isomerase B (cyclophilin B)|nr:peptidyl-prolyl cis-trans isomerase [Fibrobacter sp.]